MVELEVGKTYKITSPFKEYKDAAFKEVTNTYKVLDKQENLYRMSPYQVELSCQEDYFAVENIVDKYLILLKITEDHKIEEI